MMQNLIILGAVFALSNPLSAENWPRFRGPTGQGLVNEKNLPLHWSASSNVAWKCEIPGQGWSSPIVWNDHVIVTSTADNGASCHVINVDRKTGTIRWNTRVFEQVPLRKEGKNSHATPTPCTDGRRVYAVFGDGSIVALGFDGSIVWTNRDVQFYSRHGLGASPILHDDRLIMPYDWSNRVGAPGSYPNVSTEERLGWQIPWDKSFIAALDVKSGKRVWTGRRGLSRIGHATPIIFRERDRDRLLSITGDAVQSFDPISGNRIWSVYCQGEGLVPSPVAGDGLVFASSGFEKTTLRAIRSGGEGDVTQTHIAWQQTKGVPTQPSLLYISPRLYAITDGGIVTCYQGNTGEILWQERVGGNHSASPIHADGRIYFLSEQGESAVIEAGAEYRLLARNSIGEKCQASYAVSQRQIFIRSEKHLYCIGDPGRAAAGAVRTGGAR